MLTYASWLSRVGASLLDALAVSFIAAVTTVPWLVMFFVTAEYETRRFDSGTGFEAEIVGADWFWLAPAAIGALLTGIFALWNVVWRQSRRGQSLGKSVLGIEVVNAATGEHLSLGTSLLRAVLNSVLGNACFINYLWPLFEERKRTWHDMIVDSVVIEARRS